MTAITFVALGTSLPDLFASQAAAVGEDTADDAINNVLGSNGINVFLGLGVPHLIASIYWKAKGGVFEVDQGDTPFSVTLFIALAAVAVGVILYRRYALGHSELGGRGRIPCAAILIVCWLIYIVGASLKAYEHI